MQRRRIIFVRHGESTWNEAFNPKGMKHKLTAPLTLLYSLTTEAYLMLTGSRDSWCCAGLAALQPRAVVVGRAGMGMGLPLLSVSQVPPRPRFILAPAPPSQGFTIRRSTSWGTSRRAAAPLRRCAALPALYRSRLCWAQ